MFGMGVCELQRGEGDSALDWLERARALYRDLGELRGWGLSTLSMVILFHARGRLDEAADLATEVACVGEETGDRQLWARGTGYHGGVLVMAGRLDAGLLLLQRSQALCRSFNDPMSLAMIAGFHAMALLAEGNAVAAAHVAEESAHFLDESGINCLGTVFVRSALAEAYLMIAAEAPAAEQQTALKRARSAINAVSQQARVHHEAAFLAERWRGTWEWLNNHPHAARCWWERSLSNAESAGADWETARTHLEIYRYANDGAARLAAEQILRKIGSNYELGAVRPLRGLETLQARAVGAARSTT
jgi:hypothetical protein